MILLFCVLSCREAKYQPILIKQSFDGEKSLYSITFSNSSDSNLFFLLPSIYVEFKNNNSFYIADNIQLEAENYLGVHIPPKVGIYAFGSYLYEKNYFSSHCASLRKKLGSNLINDITVDCIFQKDLKLYGGLIFIENKTSIKFNFLINENFPGGVYRVYYEYPPFVLKSPKHIDFNNKMKKINEIDGYLFYLFPEGLGKDTLKIKI